MCKFDWEAVGGIQPTAGRTGQDEPIQSVASNNVVFWPGIQRLTVESCVSPVSAEPRYILVEPCSWTVFGVDAIKNTLFMYKKAIFSILSCLAIHYVTTSRTCYIITTPHLTYTSSTYSCRTPSRRRNRQPVQIVHSTPMFHLPSHRQRPDHLRPQRRSGIAAQRLLLIYSPQPPQRRQSRICNMSSTSCMHIRRHHMR